MMLRNVWVLHWRYRDGSASGVTAAFDDPEDASNWLRVLTEYGDGMRKFEVWPEPPNLAHEPSETRHRAA